RSRSANFPPEAAEVGKRALRLRLELTRPQLGAVILRRCAESAAAAEIIFLPFLRTRVRPRHLQPVVESLTAVGPDAIGVADLWICVDRANFRLHGFNQPAWDRKDHAERLVALEC